MSSLPNRFPIFHVGDVKFLPTMTARVVSVELDFSHYV